MTNILRIEDVSNWKINLFTSLCTRPGIDYRFKTRNGKVYLLEIENDEDSWTSSLPLIKW